MISIIVAVAEYGVIGKEGDLPWKLSDDLRHFAKVTKGHTVIMGRKTYESIMKRLGHPLPGRKSVVITSQSDYSAPGCVVVHSVDEIIKMFSSVAEESFVIGGGEVYKQLLPTANKLYITEVHTMCQGDTFFPPYQMGGWERISSEYHNKDERNSCDFTFLELIRK